MTEDDWDRELERHKKQQERIEYVMQVISAVVIFLLMVAAVVYNIYREIHIWRLD